MFKSLVTIFLFASLITTAAAETVELGRFEMESSWPSTEVSRLGAEAVDTHWPADKSYEECAAHLIVVDFDAETMTMMSEDGGDPFVYALATYLAIYGEPEAGEETQFMGTTCQRKTYRSSVPREHKLYVFSNKMQDGSCVIVGLRVFEVTEETEKLLENISKSFRLKK